MSTGYSMSRRRWRPKPNRMPRADSAAAVGGLFVAAARWLAERRRQTHQGRVRDQPTPRASAGRHRQGEGGGHLRGSSPSIVAARVRELKDQGMRPVDIAKALKIGRASVYRLLAQAL